ncbi:radical SAM protein [Streptomyces sp. 12297]
MVRANHDGRLVTLNYGRSVHATEETIETEAVFHYAPGARILSMGNVGCMLNCDYCHNWKTSQARYVEDKDVYQYTPEEVVDIAVRHGIKVISWTYNDPVDGTSSSWRPPRSPRPPASSTSTSPPSSSAARRSKNSFP